MADLRLLVFGGCNLRAPLRDAMRNARSRAQPDEGCAPVAFKIAGPPFLTYTFGEMLQAIACYRGERRIPAELNGLCGATPRGSPTPANSPLEVCDVALAEPNTSHEILFEGYHINRAPVWNLLAPFRRLSPTGRALCWQWYDKGIVALDEAARGGAAESLLALAREDMPERELTAAILRGARGARRDVREGMERLAEALETPLGIVTFTWTYMADGRAISWPAEFHGQVVCAAAELGLPLFEPHRQVERAGVAFALGPDLRHYTKAFMPVIAGPLSEFAALVAQTSRPN